MFCHVIKELVHAFSCVYIELWMHLGSLESTQEARVTLGYHLEQLLQFLPALQTSRVRPKRHIRMLSVNQFLKRNRICLKVPALNQSLLTHFLQSTSGFPAKFLLSKGSIRVHCIYISFTAWSNLVWHLHHKHNNYIIDNNYTNYLHV